MEDFAINPESFRSKMKIPPELEKQYKAAVKVGLRLMFDEDMADKTLEYMDGSGEMPKKIGEGIAGVMQFIAQEANGTFPGELIIPVGVELIAHVVDVAEKGGLPVDPSDVAEGMTKFIEIILGKAGISPDQLDQAAGGAGQEVAEV